jgi:hypothetical protein
MSPPLLVQMNGFGSALAASPSAFDSFGAPLGNDRYLREAAGRRPVVNYRSGSIPASSRWPSPRARQRRRATLSSAAGARCDFAAKSVASMPAGVGHGGRTPGRVGRLSVVSPDP